MKKLNCRWIEICPLRKFEKEGKLSLRWKKEFCQKNFNRCERYIDGLHRRDHPDNMLPDGTID